MPQLWNHLYLNIVFLVMLMMIKSVESHISDTTFDIVKPNKWIVGRTGAEQPARSKIECSSMCLSNDSCRGYQYKDQRAGLGQCILIHSSCEERFQSSGSTVAYKKVSGQSDEIEQTNETWALSPGWTGPSAVLYQSFDSSNGIVLMEGTEAVPNCVPLVSGKVNFALTLNRTKSQWVDLGIHTEACMTQPETCGAAGGAISFWVNVIYCSSSSAGGIVSSYASGFTGTRIYCIGSYIYFQVHLATGYFHIVYPRPTGWTHIVLNYIGPNNGEGIRMFLDGTEVKSDTTKSSYPPSAGDGRIVVGRINTDQDREYASVMVDELIYFNASLTSDHVQLIYT